MRDQPEDLNDECGAWRRYNILRRQGSFAYWAVNAFWLLYGGIALYELQFRFGVPLLAGFLFLGLMVFLVGRMGRWLCSYCALQKLLCPKCNAHFYEQKRRDFFSLEWLPEECNNCGAKPLPESWSQNVKRPLWLQTFVRKLWVYRLIVMMMAPAPAALAIIFACFARDPNLPNPIYNDDHVRPIVFGLCGILTILAIQIGGRYACPKCNHQVFCMQHIGHRAAWVNMADFIARCYCPHCGLFFEEFTKPETARDSADH